MGEVHNRMANVKFTDVELMAQASLREHSAWLASHPRMCSNGRTLIMSVGDDLVQAAAVAFVRMFHRVIFFGACADVRVTAAALQAERKSVDTHLTWVSGLTPTILPLVTQLCTQRPAISTLRVDYLNADAPKNVITGVQRLQRECGVVPLPEDFLRDTQRLITAYAFDPSGEIVATSCCMKLRLEASFPRTAAMGHNSCVRQEYRHAGLGRLLKAAAIREGIERFSADYVAAVVETGNDPSLKMNAACGLVTDHVVSVAYAEARADSSSLLDDHATASS